MKDKPDIIIHGSLSFYLNPLIYGSIEISIVAFLLFNKICKIVSIHYNYERMVRFTILSVLGSLMIIGDIFNMTHNYT